MFNWGDLTLKLGASAMAFHPRHVPPRFSVSPDGTGAPVRGRAVLSGGDRRTASRVARASTPPSDGRAAGVDRSPGRRAAQASPGAHGEAASGPLASGGLGPARESSRRKRPPPRGERAERGAVGTRTGRALVTARRSLLSVSDSVRGSRGCGLGHAASSESLAKNSDGGEARIGLQGESESWEGSLWERGRHRRARWGPWLDTHGLLPECGPGLTARAPRGGGKGARDPLPLGAPCAAPWLLLPLSPPPTPLLSSPGGINHGAGEMEQQPAAGLALGCPPPPPRTPTLSTPGLWDGRLRPACQDGGLSKKQQINCQRDHTATLATTHLPGLRQPEGKSAFFLF